MKSIVLVDPSKSAKSTYGNATALSMFVLREIAERKGHHATIVNLSKQGEEGLFETIQKEKPGIIGFTATSPAHAQAVSLARKIRAEYPRIQLIKGGIHERYSASFSRREQAYPFDVSFIGESDLAFVQFLDGGISQPVLRTADPAPREFVLPPIRADILEIPFELLGGSSMLRMQTMRGCGFACSFCAIKGASRRLDPALAIDYVRRAQEMGVQSMFFEDATFTIDTHNSRIGEIAKKPWKEGWTAQFCRQMRETGLAAKMRIGIQTRIDCLTSDTAQLLAGSGVKTVYIGIESLGESVDVSKGLQGDCNVIENIKNALKTGLKMTVSLICDLGTECEFITTLARLAELGIQEFFIEAYKLFPGTGLSKNREEKVLAAYEQGIGTTGSLNPEDDNCLLMNDIWTINQRYALADRILEGAYRKVDEGHYIRL